MLFIKSPKLFHERRGSCDVMTLHVHSIATRLMGHIALPSRNPRQGSDRELRQCADGTKLASSCFGTQHSKMKPRVCKQVAQRHARKQQLPHEASNNDDRDDLPSHANIVLSDPARLLR
jgi:hypothetical protein